MPDTGVDNPAFVADAKVENADENANFYANLSSKLSWPRMENLGYFVKLSTKIS